MSRKTKAAAIGALLLAAGGAASSKTSQTSQALKKLNRYERNYIKAMELAREKAKAQTVSMIEKLHGGPLSFAPENTRKLERALSIIRKYADPYSDPTLETEFTKSVAAKWSKDGVMPQELFDAVIEHQVPKLDEWDVLAHGSIVEKKDKIEEFVVPPKTVVVFWNLPGTSTAFATLPGLLPGLQPIPTTTYAGRQLSAKAKTGNATARPGAYSVMHVSGDQIPDVALTFNDPNGLPTGVFKSSTGKLDPLKKERSTLSQFLRENGPGVYYVASCRPTYRVSKEVVQNAIARTQRARERQRKYSPPHKFDNPKWNKQQTNIISSGSISNAGGPSSIDLRLSGLSDFRNELLILSICLRIFLPYLMSGTTAIFIKGPTLEELSLLFRLASFNFGAVIPWNPSSPLKIYPTVRAALVALSLGKDFIYRRRQRYAKKYRELREVVASAEAKNSEKKEYENARKLRKYGFDTTNALQLNRLRALHRKRFTTPLNKKALDDMEDAYALALRKKMADAVVVSTVRSLFSRLRQKANARKVTIATPQSHRKTDQFLKSWGFKTGMTKNAIEKRYDTVKSRYPLTNRILGRVPKDLTTAYNLAKTHAR